ncbi:MAG TPA: AraC family transcriptional regulator [Prolixibacteraceae bacterium]|jgi:AraC-like DNA-binding protein|nr:AraC family transcriptional regulator [Prolixibacteraceae bacterium]
MGLSKNNIQREITPLAQGDCLLVFDRVKTHFDFPVHFHPEFELNFVFNAIDAERNVGDHKSLIQEYELVLVGPNVYHGWDNGQCKSDRIHEITIQFPRDLIHESLLSRNMMKPLKEMLANASAGILFDDHTTRLIAPRLQELSQRNGMEAFIELISILNILSVSEHQKLLCPFPLNSSNVANSDRIKKVYEYIERNYQEKIKVEEVADLLHMTETTLSRLMRQRTGKSFIDFLNDYRIGFATRWLTETNQSVSEIAFRCGFYNISNFNRIFKKNKGCTPGEYRMNFSGIKRVS